MKKVLIVEDEVVSALNLKINLKRLNFEISAVTAYGEEAVQLAIKEQPDIILMDINLADSMTGIDAAAKIRSFYSPYIIFITGSNDKKYFEQIDSLEADLVHKPYIMEQIISPIKKRFSLSKAEEV